MYLVVLAVVLLIFAGSLIIVRTLGVALIRLATSRARQGRIEIRCQSAPQLGEEHGRDGRGRSGRSGSAGDR